LFQKKRESKLEKEIR